VAVEIGLGAGSELGSALAVSWALSSLSFWIENMAEGTTMMAGL
jgi:hypothetical protein